jgi:hypothetical protein
MDFVEVNAFFEHKHPEAVASAKKAQLLHAQKLMAQKGR